MDKQTLRLLIQRKLDEGRIPHDSIPRVWGGPGNGEVCDACEELISKDQFVMEGVAMDHGRASVQFHVRCFYLWDEIRHVPGRD